MSHAKMLSIMRRALITLWFGARFILSGSPFAYAAMLLALLLTLARTQRS